MGKASAIRARKGWQEHSCRFCGTVYRYRFAIEAVGEGATEKDAEEAAAKALRKAMRDHPEMRPCPECGRIQPSAILGWRLGGLGLLCVAAIVGFWMVFVLAGNDHFFTQTVVWLATGLTVFLLAGHLFVVYRSFPVKRDPQA